MAAYQSDAADVFRGDFFPTRFRVGSGSRYAIYDVRIPGYRYTAVSHNPAERDVDGRRIHGPDRNSSSEINFPLVLTRRYCTAVFNFSRIVFRWWPSPLVLARV